CQGVKDAAALALSFSRGAPPRAAALSGKDPATPVRGAGSPPPRTPPPPRCSRAGELLDAVVVRIRDVDVPAPVGRHEPGRHDLAVARAGTPPRGEEGSARIELLDAVVAQIRDVDVPAPRRSPRQRGR